MTRARTQAEPAAEPAAPAAPIIPPAARSARSRTLHKVVDTGALSFDLVPYRVGDRIRLNSVVSADVNMEGVVKSYNGKKVVVTIDKKTGDGKFDDWLLEIVTSSIPAPPSPDETEAAAVKAVAAFDPLGGSVILEFARKVIALTRELDDMRDLAHYLRNFAIEFDEEKFTMNLMMDEKNCELSPEVAAELAAELARPPGQQRTRHLDIDEKNRKAAT